MEKTVSKDAISYPEVVRELGVVIRKFQDILAPYDGCIRLESISDDQYEDGYNVIDYFTARLRVSYDPQKFHQGIAQSDRPAECTV
jgi:hypothetical protein